MLYQEHGVDVNDEKTDRSSRRLICYCFGYTRGDIERDARDNGRSTILERILEEKKRGGCRCAELNPGGR